MKNVIFRIFIIYVRNLKSLNKKALVLFDLFKVHTTDRVHSILEDNNIVFTFMFQTVTRQIATLGSVGKQSCEMFSKSPFGMPLK